MNDIQTEMIMNSDSSNIVNDILKELNNTPPPISQPTQNNTIQMPPQMQMQNIAQPVKNIPQPNLGLNENAVINQYDNSAISNEMHLNRQMDPHVNLNPNSRLNTQAQMNKGKIINNKTNNSKKLFSRYTIIQILKLVKNIVILCVILLLFLSPITSKILVKYLPKLYSSSSSQIFKWVGLIIKVLTISIVYNVLYIFV